MCPHTHVSDHSYGPNLQVGFVNLIKRPKDQMNHIWVAEATENSDYFFSFYLPQYYHLKNAAASAERWAKVSTLVGIVKFCDVLNDI